MSDSPRRQAVVVGLVVTAATVLLAGAVLTVGDLNDTFSRKLEVSAVFDEVGGLQVGDNVWFSGVKVGTVRRLAFRPGSAVEVGLAIDRAAAAFIPGDAEATIGSDGLIGNRIVVLSAGTPGVAATADGAVLVVGQSTSTEDMMEMFQENNTHLLAITTDLEKLSGRLAAGEGTVGRLLGDDTLYVGVAATAEELRAASVDARRTSAALAAFSAKLGAEGRLPDDLVTDEVLYASLTASAEDLVAVAAHASSLAENLEEGLADPERALGALINDPGAGADTRSVLANLDEGTRLLAEDLEALQHNVFLRGWFNKKQRRADRAARRESR